MSESPDRDPSHLSPAMQVCLVDLQATFDFVVVETLRSYQRQLEMLKTGKSKTLHSKHLTGNSMDIMPKGGYDKWKEADWMKIHDAWDAIVISHGYVPEPRIRWDLNHLGIMG